VSSPDQNLDQGRTRMRSTPRQCGTKGPSERAQPSKRTVHSEHSAFFESLHLAPAAGSALSFLHASHVLQCAVTLRHRNYSARPSAEARVVDLTSVLYAEPCCQPPPLHISRRRGPPALLRCRHATYLRQRPPPLHDFHDCSLADSAFCIPHLNTRVRHFRTLNLCPPTRAAPQVGPGIPFHSTRH
jgi:hypothetical protein